MSWPSSSVSPFRDPLPLVSEKPNKSPLSPTAAVTNKKISKLSKRLPVKTLPPSIPHPYTNKTSSWDRPYDKPIETEPLMPPTPAKKAAARKFSTGMTDSKFEKIYKSLESGSFSRDSLALTTSLLGVGSYCRVYRIDELPNLVIKAHHGNTGYKFSTQSLNALLNHALTNYRNIVARDLPVAKLLNEKTALEEGFFLQLKIPYEIDIFNLKHIEQVALFFTSSVVDDIMMDLQPQNLRVTEEGTVVLIDFVEEEEAVSLLITKACREWICLCQDKGLAKKEGKKLLLQLTSGFLNSSPKYTTLWLKDLLDT